MVNLSDTLNILIDMDVLVFRASLVGEETTVWQPATEHSEAIVTTELNFGRSKAYLGTAVSSIVSKVLKYKEWHSEYKVIPCLSDKVNFRKSLYPAYKANRTKPKPQLYADVRRYAEENWECQCYPMVEADDCIGILATSLPNAVICSIDKDFLTIPNVTFYNFHGDKDVFIETTTESAMSAFYFQCLLGDSVDNIKGCVGIGKVKAAKILAEDCSWESVISTYESKGQTLEDAVLNARLVRILTVDLWDAENQCPILWTPKDYLCPSM